MNCLFAYPDRTINTTLSTTGTTWSNTLPLNNLKDYLRGRTARSTGITTAHTKFDITYPAATIIGMLSIVGHNISISGTVKLSFGTTLGASDLGTVSGLSPWNPFYPDNSNISTADALLYTPRPDFWYVLPSPVSAGFVRVEITDTSNPDGYVELGRCFTAPVFTPAVNIEYDCSIVWKQDVLKDKAIGGVEWFEILSAGREISGKLDLSESEGMINVFDRQRRLGQEGELYFILDPSDTYVLYKQRAMLCRHADEDPLRFPFFDRTSGSFQLSEVR